MLPGYESFNAGLITGFCEENADKSLDKNEFLSQNIFLVSSYQINPELIVSIKSFDDL